MVAKIVATLITLVKDTNADVRRSSFKAVKRFAKYSPGMGGRAIEVWRVCSKDRGTTSFLPRHSSAPVFVL
jgi:hypothetical protein